MENEILTGLYRKIGNRFRLLGADRVIVLSSRADNACLNRIIMEVAVSGDVDVRSLEECVSDCWDNIEVRIFLLDENPEIDYEDGAIVL